MAMKRGNVIAAAIRPGDSPGAARQKFLPLSLASRVLCLAEMGPTIFGEENCPPQPLHKVCGMAPETSCDRSRGSGVK